MNQIVNTIASHYLLTIKIIILPYLLLTVIYLIASKKKQTTKFLQKYIDIIRLIEKKIPTKLISIIQNKKILAIIFFIILLIINLRYFEFKDPLFSSDDPAIHLTAIKCLIEGKALDYYFFPSYHYNVPIFYGYYLIKYITLIFGLNYIIATKLVIIIAYTAVPILFFLYSSNHFKNFLFPLAIALLINFDHLFQSLFWSGNINQIIGLVFVALILLILGNKNNFSQIKKIDYLSVLALFLLSYKFHNLTFLFLGILLFLYVQLLIYKKSKVLFIFFILLSAIVLPILFLKSPGNFPLYSVGFSLGGTFLGGLNSFGIEIVIATASLLGLFIVAKSWKSPILVVLALLSLSMSSAGNSSLGFYPERFCVYLSIAIIILCYAFFDWMISRISRAAAFTNFCVLSSIFVTIPLFISSSLILRTIYHGEVALPARIPEEDVNAMKWLETNTDSDSIIGGPFKWSEYIPVLANRRVIYYPDGVINIPDKDLKNNLRNLFTGNDSEVAYRSAIDLKVDYILWEYQLNESKNLFFKDIGYKNNFSDDIYFEKVYDKNSVQIYKVK